MYGNPNIARVAEDTVLNLKQLESRLGVLCNDLAQLCTAVGHHEAARIAVTPAAWLGIGQQGISPFSNVGTVGSFGVSGITTPFQGVSPYGVQPTPWATPYATPYQTPIATPFANPYPVSAPPFSPLR